MHRETFKDIEGKNIIIEPNCMRFREYRDFETKELTYCYVIVDDIEYLVSESTYLKLKEVYGDE